MSVPGGLLGIALLVWGVSIGHLAIGAVAAVLLEAVRFLQRATPVPRETAVRVLRFTLLAILLALGYAAIAASFPQALYEWLRWLPLVAAALPAMQRHSGGLLPLGEHGVDVTHAYAALVLLAAGTGASAGPWLYPAYAVIAGWAIAARAAPSRRAVTGALLLVAAALGYGVHSGVSALQGEVEEWSTEFFSELFAARSDAFRERTRIGETGRITLSDRIVMRVTTPSPRPDEILLREAAFERYRNGEWQAVSPVPVRVAHEGERWTIAAGEAPRRLTLRRTTATDALLPLPMQARSIEHLAADAMERMPTGAVRAHGMPRLLDIDIAYGADAPDAPPRPTDLETPPVLQEVLDRVIADERLRGPDAQATLAATRAFFAARFAYSLDLGARGASAPRTISDFLLSDRKGHCEYFATATTLLMRRAGVPARYVAGYSVQEYSPIEGAFVVRGRHAHAWTQAFVGGRWVEVDTTPSRWAAVEEEQMHGWLGSLLDRLSWAADRFLRWWYEGVGAGWEDAARVAGAAILAMLAIAGAFLLFRRQARRPRRPAPDAVGRAWQRVESSLAHAHGRSPGETPRAWAERLRREQPGQAWREQLVELARGYYAARFDPAAAGAGEAFIARASAWKPPA